MISAFGVDHGEISKVAVKPTALLRKLPKAGKLFGRAGAKTAQGPAKPNMGFRAGEKAGQGARAGFGAIGMGAGKGASALGMGRLGAAMQRSPVKAGVTTSFIGGTAGYGTFGMMKKPKQPGQP